MKKEKFFDTLKTILDQSGMDELVEVSSQPYETADFCVIDDIYLGLDVMRTVPFGCIERISYVAGEDKCYQYDGGFLQIVFKLRAISTLYMKGEIELMPIGLLHRVAIL